MGKKKKTNWAPFPTYRDDANKPPAAQFTGRVDAPPGPEHSTERTTAQHASPLPPPAPLHAAAAQDHPLYWFLVSDQLLPGEGTEGLGFRTDTDPEARVPEGDMIPWHSVVAGRIVLSSSAPAEGASTGGGKPWLEVAGWFLPVFVERYGVPRQVVTAADADQVRNLVRFEGDEDARAVVWQGGGQEPPRLLGQHDASCLTKKLPGRRHGEELASTGNTENTDRGHRVEDGPVSSSWAVQLGPDKNDIWTDQTTINQFVMLQKLSPEDKTTVKNMVRQFLYNPVTAWDLLYEREIARLLGDSVARMVEEIARRASMLRTHREKTGESHLLSLFNALICEGRTTSGERVFLSQHNTCLTHLYTYLPHYLWCHDCI